MKQIALLSVALAAAVMFASDEVRADSGNSDGWSAIAIVRAVDAYATAWRNNDPEAVIACFTDDFTLSPSGMPFVEGADAARQFWWPAGAPPARVIDFRIEPLESSESGGTGYVRGYYDLEFEYEGSVTATRGKFLSILEHGAEGWKIRHHFWDVLPADRET